MNSLTKPGRTSARQAGKLVCVAALILTCFWSAASQTAPAGPVEEMRKLEFLLGEWKGGGWVVHWDGSRGEEFSQKTKVQAREGGSVLRIKDARDYTTPGVSHTSSLDASISYDERAKIYLWRGELPGRQSIPLEANLIGVRTFQSGVPFTVAVPLKNGARRTTIKVTESGEWHETLEVWKIDRWYKVEESILRRVK